MISSCDDDNPAFKTSALAGATAGPTEGTQEPDIETVDTQFVGELSMWSIGGVTRANG